MRRLWAPTALLFAVAVGVAVAPVVGQAAAAWQVCHDLGVREHLVTSWTPWDGCTVTVLGTVVRLGS